jgi:hypothetical protein
MAIVQIFDKDSNRAYTVTVVLNSGLTQTDDSATQEGQGNTEYYLTITTSIPQEDGTQFPVFIAKTLDDVAPDQPSPAAGWDELMAGYIEYFQGASLYVSTSSSKSSSSISPESSGSSGSSRSSSSSSSSSISISDSSDLSSTSNEFETLGTLYDRVNGFDGTGFDGALRGRGSECTWFGQFDGVGYVEETSLVGTLDLTSNFTVSLWVKTTIDGGQWFTLGNTADVNPYFVISTSGGNPFVNMRNDAEVGKLVFIPSTSILDDAWHNITLVFDGSDYFIYVDGSSLGSVVGALAGPYTFDNMLFSGFKNGNNTPTGLATGRAAGIRVYQRDLSGGEVATLDGAGECGDIDIISTASMLAFYDFDPDPNYSSSSSNSSNSS